MSGRRTPPLFDLLSKKGSAGVGLPNVNVPRPEAPKPDLRSYPPGAQVNGKNPAGAPVPTLHGPLTDPATGKPIVRVELKPAPRAEQGEHAVQSAAHSASHGAPLGNAREASHNASAGVIGGVLGGASSSHAGNSSHAASSRDPVLAVKTRTGFWSDVSGGRSLRVPTVLAYVLGFLAIPAIVVAVWITAYKLGDKSGKDSMSELVRKNAPPVVEPGALANNSGAPAGASQGSLVTINQTGNQPGAQTGDNRGTAIDVPNAGTSRPQAPGDSQGAPPPNASIAPTVSAEDLIAKPLVGGTMTSRGWVDNDPRIAGLNYLELVSLSRDDAARGVVFLARNGVDAIAVPVDGKGKSGNNPSPKYRLIAWPGLSPEQLKEGQARPRLEREVARIGKAWLEQRGPSDFRMPLWTKFKG